MANREKWGDGGWGDGGGWENQGKTGKDFWKWDPKDPNNVDAEIEDLDPPEPGPTRPPLDPNSWPTERSKQTEARLFNYLPQSDRTPNFVHSHQADQEIIRRFNQKSQSSEQMNSPSQYRSQEPLGAFSSWGRDFPSDISHYQGSLKHPQPVIPRAWEQYNQELESSDHVSNPCEYAVRRPLGNSSGWTGDVPTKAVPSHSQLGFNRYQPIPPEERADYQQESTFLSRQNRLEEFEMQEGEETSSGNRSCSLDVALSAGRLATYRQALANPVSLLRQTEMAQNPLNAALDLRRTILSTSKDSLMQNAMKRYRGVREVDPAAAARRQFRERNRPKKHLFIPSKKMARKFVGTPMNVRPPQRVPSPESAIADDSCMGAASQPVQLEGSVLRPGWSRSFNAIPIIPLGRDGKDRMATDLISVPDMKDRVEVELEEIPTSPDEPGESINSMDLDISVVEVTTKLLKVDVDRDCIYPNLKSGIVGAHTWRSSEGEVGWISQTCLCSAESESVKSPEITKMLSAKDTESVARGIKMGCSATFRDEKRLLNGCGRSLDFKTQEDLLVQWLPQLGVFGFFCHFHLKLLRQHKICPYCNEFFQSGNKDFVVCCKTKNEVHLFHLDCQVRMDMAQECPHCLADQRACIKEWYDGKDAMLPLSKPSHEECDLFEDSDLRYGLRIPDGKDGFFSLEGYVSRDEMKELEALSKNPILCAKEDLMSDLPGLSLSVLLSTKTQFPDLLKQKKKNGDSLLHEAARMGKVIAAFLLHKFGLAKNAVNIAGETPLIVAVKNRQRHVMYCLVLVVGVDVNEQDKEGRTAFHWAAIQQSSQMMRFLLENGADSSIKDNLGFTAVFHTLTWIRDVEFYGLVMACIGLTHLDRDGWSLMHWVAFLHRNDLLDNFYDLGVAFVADKWADTPMHVAVRVGNLEFVRLLLTVRPPLEVMLRNKQGDTPYHLAEQLMEHSQTEVGRMAKEIATLMWQLMPDRLLAIPALKMRRSVARGEICGDISRGRNIFPIPCYNFINSMAYSHELIYSNNVVRPIVYQNDPVLDYKEMQNAGFIGPCKLPPGATNCESVKCLCMAVKLCPKKRNRVFCSDECRDDNGHHYVSDIIDGCYVPFAVGSGPISLPFPGKRKPAPADIRRLQTRLRQQAALRVELSDDLLHILDLLHCEFRPDDRRRRSLSVGRESRLRTLPHTVEGATGKRRLRSRSLDRAKQEEWLGWNQFGEEASSSAITASSLSITQLERNEMDLFDEIERFQLSFLTQAAVCRFERRHPFDRWDLSLAYRNAPRRHLLGKNEGKHRRLDEETLLAVDDWTALLGCSIKCACGPDCSNRILQRPSIARMALVYVNDIVSWGVIALTKIFRGQYLTDFFNHSCNPNSKALEVHEHGIIIPRICLVALRTIHPGQPVTLNYGDKWWSAKQANEGIVCLCGEDTCKFSKLPAQSAEDEDDDDDEDEYQEEDSQEE